MTFRSTARRQSIRRALLALGVIATASSTATAQWSDDASVNNLLGAGAGTQNQPLLARLADGTTYVSWLENPGGGYDVRLQLVTPTGVPEWSGALTVADRSFSSTQSYGLDVDTSGAAVLAYRGDQLPGTQIVANRVLADGTMPWGDGVVLNAGNSQDVASPTIAATSDGNSVAAWTRFPNSGPSVIELRKLSPEGDILWSYTMARSTGIAASSLVASDAPGASGQCVLMTVGFGGFTSPRPLKAQKFDAEGSEMWGASDVGIFTSGSVQIGNFPTLIPDGRGGAVATWYSSVPSLRCFVQQVRADGSLRLSTSQYRVTAVGETQVNPVACIDPVSEDITCYWITQNSSQSQFSLKGQRFEGTSRAWGTTGITFLPLGSTQTTAAGCHPRYGGGTTVVWSSGFIPQPTSIFAAAVDAEGQPVWTGDAGGVSGGVGISTVDSNKSRTTTATSPSGEIVIAWSDDREGSGRRIFGQNVRADGELGDAALVGDLNGDGVVNAADLGLLIVAWGPCGKGAPCAADLNEDGIVDAADLGFLFANWS
ncbi:MAG: hypothetical protein CMJ52_08235 [Planctomycetaceae bacterium]|nr:hypothetical protein [Planctomycetaceae bacterium]